MKKSKARVDTPLRPTSSLVANYLNRFSVLGSDMGLTGNDKKDKGSKKGDKGEKGKETDKSKSTATKKDDQGAKGGSAEGGGEVLDTSRPCSRSSMASNGPDAVSSFIADIKNDLGLNPEQKQLFDKSIFGMIKAVVRDVLEGINNERGDGPKVAGSRGGGGQNYRYEEEDFSSSMILNGVQQIIARVGHRDGEFWQDKIVRFFNSRGYCLSILDVFPVYQLDGKVQVCLVRFASRFAKSLASRLIYQTRMDPANKDSLKDVFGRDAFPKGQLSRVKHLAKIGASMKRNGVATAYRISNRGDNVPLLELRRKIGDKQVWEKANARLEEEEDMETGDRVEERKRRAESSPEISIHLEGGSDARARGKLSQEAYLAEMKDTMKKREVEAKRQRRRLSFGEEAERIAHAIVHEGGDDNPNRTPLITMSPPTPNSELL